MAARALSTGCREENQAKDKANAEEGRAREAQRKRTGALAFRCFLFCYSLVSSNVHGAHYLEAPTSVERESFSHRCIHTLIQRKESAWNICMSVGPITPGLRWLVG